MPSNTVTGLNQLASALGALDAALGPDTLVPIALAAVQPMLAAAQRGIPKRTGATEHRLHAVARATRGGALAKVEVAQSGPGQPGHEAVFLEYGTVHMAAHPFLRPAFYRHQSDAVRITAAELARRLPRG